MERTSPPRRPPSVDALARSISDIELPHPLLVEAARSAIAAGTPELARRHATETAAALLRPVINATGVLLHTNLGRAPIEYRREARYGNLELDLTTGRRGSRQSHVSSLLARLCGAEDALVVNNGAAAVLLVLATLAKGRSVVVSRGELVEIGGGFRVPEVLESSGAQLREVGSTNRTRLSDYERELAAPGDVAVILKVHQSNYRVVGFTASASVTELAGLGPPVVFDIGSGLLDATTPWLKGGPPAFLTGEPAVRQSLEDGAALVTFSGDKLLGGPQAGIIAGREDLVAACGRHPLSRALRPGSIVLEALQETALAYLRRDADAIPFWRMACLSTASLEERARAIVGKLEDGSRVVDCLSVAGAGSLPGLEIASVGIALAGDKSEALRSCDPPVVARVFRGETVCDLRTVDAVDDLTLTAAIASVRS